MFISPKQYNFALITRRCKAAGGNMHILIKAFITLCFRRTENSHLSTKVRSEYSNDKCRKCVVSVHNCIVVPLLYLRREDSLLVSTGWAVRSLSTWNGHNMDSTLFLCRSEIGISSAAQNTRSMSLHIGKRIKEVLERQGRTKVWFAKEISRTPAACYHIFQCPTIDTGLLEIISKKLHHDFFQDLSADSNIK